VGRYVSCRPYPRPQAAIQEPDDSASAIFSLSVPLLHWHCTASPVLLQVCDLASIACAGRTTFEKSMPIHYRRKRSCARLVAPTPVSLTQRRRKQASNSSPSWKRQRLLFQERLTVEESRGPGGLLVASPCFGFADMATFDWL